VPTRVPYDTEIDRGLVVDAGQSAGGLAVAIAPARSAVTIGDPIVVWFALVNEWPDTVWLDMPPVLAYKFSVALQSGGGTTVLHRDPAKLGFRQAMEDPMGVLHAGKALIFPVNLTDLYTVPKAGTLRIRVAIYTMSPHVKEPEREIPATLLISNPVEILVNPR
jgi:hypothetical protein